jgi:hypothetical protein
LIPSLRRATKEKWGFSRGVSWESHATCNKKMGVNADSLRNPWEIYGKSMEIYRKSLGSLWEVSGKSLGSLWEVSGRSREGFMRRATKKGALWEVYGKSMGSLGRVSCDVQQNKRAFHRHFTGHFIGHFTGHFHRTFA